MSRTVHAQVGEVRRLLVKPGGFASDGPGFERRTGDGLGRRGSESVDHGFEAEISADVVCVAVEEEDADAGVDDSLEVGALVLTSDDSVSFISLSFSLEEQKVELTLIQSPLLTKLLYTSSFVSSQVESAPIFFMKADPWSMPLRGKE